mgnify:CR=1 FL=1
MVGLKDMIDGWIEGMIDGWIEGMIDGWIEEMIDGWIEEMIDGWIEEMFDGWIEEQGSGGLVFPRFCVVSLRCVAPCRPCRPCCLPSPTRSLTRPCVPRLGLAARVSIASIVLCILLFSRIIWRNNEFDQEGLLAHERPRTE